MARLDGKVAIVTGAASGIGAEAARIFAAEGARVVATDLDEQLLKETVGLIAGAVVAVQHDVSSSESWQDVAEVARREFGPVGVLVNNAGMHLGVGLLDVTPEQWERTMAVNTTGVWHGIRTVIPMMRELGGGSVVNCVSAAALISGFVDGGDAAYTASKGAVRALTRHVAQWYAADRIRCNAVFPGSIYTSVAKKAGFDSPEALAAVGNGTTPLPPHVGEASDIANGYLYLASDESKFVTGAELVIDGGWTSH